jgi:hypothetical protein
MGLRRAILREKPMSDPFDAERWSVLLRGRIEAGRPDRKIVFNAGGRWEASGPPVKSLSSRSERLSRAISLSDFWLL